MAEAAKKIIDWDGKIPLWGLLLMGLTFAGWVWSEVRSIDRRLTEREVSSQIYRGHVDNLVKDQQRLTTLEVEIRHIRQSLDRLVAAAERAANK